MNRVRIYLAFALVVIVAIGVPTLVQHLGG